MSHPLPHRDLASAEPTLIPPSEAYSLNAARDPEWLTYAGTAEKSETQVDVDSFRVSGYYFPADEALEEELDRMGFFEEVA